MSTFHSISRDGNTPGSDIESISKRRRLDYSPTSVCYTCIRVSEMPRWYGCVLFARTVYLKKQLFTTVNLKKQIIYDGVFEQASIYDSVLEQEHIGRKTGHTFYEVSKQALISWRYIWTGTYITTMRVYQKYGVGFMFGRMRRSHGKALERNNHNHSDDNLWWLVGIVETVFTKLFRS